MCRYVFCRQRHDSTLRRGAEQHSLVLLSEHPYSSVLVPLCQWAGPFYFNHGQIALEEVRSRPRSHLEDLCHGAPLLDLTVLSPRPGCLVKNKSWPGVLNCMLYKLCLAAWVSAAQVAVSTDAD